MDFKGVESLRTPQQIVEDLQSGVVERPPVTHIPGATFTGIGAEGAPTIPPAQFPPGQVGQPAGAPINPAQSGSGSIAEQANIFFNQGRQRVRENLLEGLSR